MSSEVASAYVSLTANIGGLTSGLAAAEAQTRRFASTADMQAKRSGAAFAAMGKVMRRGGLVAAAGIAVGLTSAVKTAANFETEMSALKSVTKASAKDMDRLKESALDLGAATKFSALEVAGAQTELARAGMSTSQILGGSLKGSLALAAAGQMELAEASATIVDTMGQFGLKVGDATHIADALAEAANATTADVAEMAQGLENVGNIARNAGLDFDQTVVALELLAKNGTKGAEAGSAFRSMLTQIATPSAKSAKKMRELNLEFYDAQGNFKDLDVVSAMLQRSFSGLTAEQKQNAAAVIAGTYGQKALLAIMAGGPKLAREYERGLQNTGQAAEMAAVMNDNLHGKLEQLGGAMETIKIRVGSALIPLLSDAAVATADWLDELGNSQGLEDFADGLADGFRSFAGAAGEAWSVAQPLLSQLGSVGADAFALLQGAAEGAGPVLLTTASAAGAVASAALSVVGPVMSAASALAGIPGVSGSATAALLGVATAFAAFKAINKGAGTVAAISAFTASLRAVAPAATATVASTRAFAAQSAQAATAVARANMIAAASQATYTKAFVGGNTVAARAAVTAAQTQIQAQTRVAAISALSARTFSSTFAPAAAKAAAPASKLGAVLGALGKRFPMTAAGLTALASPAGIAAVAIGGTTAAVLALSSGMFAGPSVAERMASGLRNVASAARDASNAISGMKSSTLNLKEANLAEQAALLSRKQAYQTLRDMTKGLTGDQLKAVKASDAYKAAQIAAGQADVRVARTNQAQQAAKRKVTAATLESIGAQLKAVQTSDRSKASVAAEIKGNERLQQILGTRGAETELLTETYEKQVKAGASVAEKNNTLRATYRQAADAAAAAGNPKLAAQLERIGSLDDSGLKSLAEGIVEVEKTGVKGFKAVTQALKGIPKSKTLKLSANDNASPKIKGVKGQLPIPNPPPIQLTANGAQALAVASQVQGAVSSIRDRVVQITAQGNFPTGSPRVYEIPALLDSIKSKTVDVTVRPHGTGELESMARSVRQPSSGDPKALKRFYGGSLEALRGAVGSAGSLLIKADLDVQNLPEVISEANQAGVSMGGAFAKEIAKGRSELARAVGQSNELIKRIETVRGLTTQLSSAKASVRSASGDEKGKARANLARIQAQLAKAQARFRAVAGDQTAAQALDGLQTKIARSIGKMRPQAAKLADAASAFTSAKEKLVESVKTQALEQFDQDTQRRLDSIRGTYEDGFQQIAGVWQTIPGKFSQLEARINMGVHAVSEALKGETAEIAEAYRVRGKTLDRALSAEMKAFDKAAQARSKAIDDQTKQEQDAIDGRYKALTASEAKLAALRGQQSDTNLNRGVIESEAALREAITKRMPEKEVADRMRAVEEARQAVQIAALEKSAETERAAADQQAEAEKEAATARGEARKEALDAQIEQERYALEDAQELRTMALQAQQTAETDAAQARADAQTQALQDQGAAERAYWQSQQDGQTAALESQRNVERASLERSLENWGTNFMRLRGMFNGNHNTMLGQVQAFSDRLTVSGERVGRSYAAGIRDSFPAVRSAAGDLAGIVSRYLELHSPADIGPLSTLDTWWSGFGKTLVGGADMRAAHRLMAEVGNPANGGSGGPGGTQTIYISNEVTVVDRTTTGMSRDQARRIASDIKPELDRIVSIR